MMSDLAAFLTAEERQAFARVQWGQSCGLGDRPALLVVDVQNYMIGEPERGDNLDRFPFSCGSQASDALPNIHSLVEACRRYRVPIFFTRFVVTDDDNSRARLRDKIGVAREFDENLYFDGTFGAALHQSIVPQPGEEVIDKARRSAFFKTPLLDALNRHDLDSLIVCGGSTSGCIRPTVCDAEQHDLRVVVAGDAVFDRFKLVHSLNLFDMGRAQADVLSTSDILDRLAATAAAAKVGMTTN